MSGAKVDRGGAAPRPRFQGSERVARKGMERMGFVRQVLVVLLCLFPLGCDGFQAISGAFRTGIQVCVPRSCSRPPPARPVLVVRMSSGDAADSPDRPDGGDEEAKPIFLKRTGGAKTQTETLFRRTESESPSLAGDERKRYKLLKAVPTTARTLAGILCIMGTERAAFHISKSLGLGFPSAPLGMVLVFAAMSVMQAVSEDLTLRTLVFFGPSRDFYKAWVPLFFSAPLVDLPLALSALPGDQVAKVLIVIASGTLLTLLSTTAIVNPLLTSSGGAGGAPQKLPPTAAAPKATVTLSAPPPLRLEAASLAATGAFFAADLAVPAVVALSVAALQAGKALPARVRGVLPPIVTGASAVCAFLCVKGWLLGTGWRAALSAYRAPGGPGLVLLSQAAPAVVALGFGLFEQRGLLKRRLVPIAGGGVCTTLLSLVSTVFLARLAGLPRAVSLGLAPRFITLPIALPIAEALGAASAVTAMSVVLEGILGANFGLRILTALGVRDPVARGISLGASSHALGTAQAYADEPDSGPSSAVTFLLCGILASCLVQVPAVKGILLLAAGPK